MISINSILKLNNFILDNAKNGDYKHPIFGNLFCGDRSHKFNHVTAEEVDDDVIQRVRHFTSTHCLADSTQNWLVVRRSNISRNRRFVVKKIVVDQLEALRNRRQYFEKIKEANSVKKFRIAYVICFKNTPISASEYVEILLLAIKLAANLELDTPVIPSKCAEEFKKAAESLVDTYDFAVTAGIETSIPDKDYYVRQVEALQNKKVTREISHPHAHGDKEVVKEILTETTVDSLPVIGPAVNLLHKVTTHSGVDTVAEVAHFVGEQAETGLKCFEIMHMTGFTHFIGGFASPLNKALDCIPFLGTLLTAGIIFKHVNHLINCIKLKGCISSISSAIRDSTDIKVWQQAVRVVLDSRNPSKTEAVQKALIKGGNALEKVHSRNQKRWKKLAMANVFTALNTLLKDNLSNSSFIKIVTRIHTNLRNRMIVEALQLGKNGSFMAFSLIAIVFPPSIPLVLAALGANIASTLALVGTEKALENTQLHKVT